MTRWLRKAYDEPVDVLEVFYDTEVNGENAKYLVNLYDKVETPEEKKEIIDKLQEILDQHEPETGTQMIGRLDDIGKSEIAEKLKTW